MVHLKLILILFAICSNGYSKINPNSYRLLPRNKRSLIYMPGLNWAQMVIGIGFPVDIKGHSLTVGVAIKSYYELPNNSTHFTMPLTYQTLEERKRTRRNVDTEYNNDLNHALNRWDIYKAIIKYGTSLGYGNTKICLLKAICESSSAKFDDSTGLLAQIMHLLLTPTSTGEIIESNEENSYIEAEIRGREGHDCNHLFKDCDALDFMSRFTKTFS